MPIQISVTVLGPPGGRGASGDGRGEAVDVRVTAPEGTPLADVLGPLAATAAPGCGTPRAVFCEDRRLDPRRVLLGQPPLVDGAVLAFHQPLTTPVPEPVPARLLVVAGPDAGGVHLLRGGEVRIGRSAKADVPLDDPDVSRLHCAVFVGADRSVTVTDLGSTNGTLLDGEPVTGPVRVPPGATLRLGESTVRIVTDDLPAPAGGQPTPSQPRRAGAAGPPGPPAPGAPVPPPPTEPPAPPGGRRPARGLAGLARRISGVVAGGETHAGVLLPPQLAKAGSASRPAPRQPAGAPAPAPGPAADPTAEARWPDLATVLLTALTPDGPTRGRRLWDRAASHPDAFGVRLGTVQRAVSRPAPVGLRLPEIGSLGLAGPRRRLAGLARSLLAQLAAAHPPSALELVVVAPGRAEEWSWLCWLPHLRPARGQDCRALVAFDDDQAAARTRELTERTDPDPTGRRTVVLVDDEGADPELRWRLARLAATGPATGTHLVCLAETPPATAASPLAETLARARESSPAFAACGTVGLLSGAVASALRLSGPTGPTGPTGMGEVAAPAITVDAVSSAWADRFARALAPLREEGGARAGVPAGPTEPPPSCRLLDVLSLPRVTPGALRDRWAQGRGLPLVLGAAADGVTTLELTEATGPVRIEGDRGSGRTELLCSLAASLAAAQGPRDLTLLLVEGVGEGLRVAAELPHVASYLKATDPVRMRAFAQALREELKRRAALLDEAGAPATAAFGAVARPGARVVAPREAADERPGRGAAGEQPGPGPAGEEPDAAPPMRAVGSGPLPWLVVLVDDLDALLAPPLGAPGRQAAGSVVRALSAAAREGRRLGVRVITAGAPGAELPQAPGAEIRVALTGPPAGRAELRRRSAAGGAGAGREDTGRDSTGRDGAGRDGDGREEVRRFQAARVTGRIPRTSTLRPTVVRCDWARAGDPVSRRPVRELGNGPTDVALLASAASRAARVDRETTASLV